MHNELKVKIDNNLSEPLYLQVRNQIKEYIISNNLPAHTRLPDVQTLSDKASVSLGTMEKALRSLIGDGICYRRPKKGTFVGQKAEAAYEGGSKKVCGILHSQEKLSFEDDALLLSIYKGIQKEARKEDIDIIILTEKSLSFYESLHSIDFMGVILLQWRDVDSLLKLVNNHPLQRFIVLNYLLDDFDKLPENVSGIFNSDFSGSFEATAALLRRGHEACSVISVEITDRTYTTRVEGVMHALSDGGIPSDKNILFTDKKLVDPSKEQQRLLGRSLAEKILKQKPDTTAIICVNDILAEGVIDFLDTNKLRDKVEVLGYDNIWPLSKEKNFSTVSIAFDNMGIKAIQILNNKDIKYPKLLMMPPVFLPRWNVVPQELAAIG